MRLLFVSLLILNLFFGAWNLERRLSGSGNLQNSIWFVICLATSILCFIELRYQKMSSSLGRPSLGDLEKFLERSTLEEAPAEASDEEEESHCQSEPEGEDLKRAA